MNNDWIKQYCQKQAELSEIIFNELIQALDENKDDNTSATSDKQD